MVENIPVILYLNMTFKKVFLLKQGGGMETVLNWLQAMKGKTKSREH